MARRNRRELDAIIASVVAILTRSKELDAILERARGNLEGQTRRPPSR